MKILITGANGFIGRHLVAVLTEKHKVRAFGRTEPESKEIEFVKGDIRDFDSIKKALGGIEEVIHLGAITAGKEALLTLDSNVKGTYNLIEAAVQKKVKRIIFASSIAAYGCLSEDFVPEYLPIDEKHPCVCEDMYGLSKFLGEEILKCYTRKENITTICLRLSWVQDTQERKSFRSASEVTLWSTVDVSDVVEAIVLCLESNIKGNDIFNIAAEDIWAEETSMDIVRKYYPQIEIDRNYFLKNPHASLFDISKSKRVLGFKPGYEF